MTDWEEAGSPRAPRRPGEGDVVATASDGRTFLRYDDMMPLRGMQGDLEAMALYVRREADDGWRRGVVFIKEIVPRAAIALVARWLYNENYVALPTGHAILRSHDNPGNIESVKYYWTFRDAAQFVEILTRGEPYPFDEGSEEEFITQHFWGYSAQKDGGTVEYRVEHPSWRVWRAQSCRLEGDVENFYGKQFTNALKAKPSSAFLAEGSEITVYKGRRIA